VQFLSLPGEGVGTRILVCTSVEAIDACEEKENRANPELDYQTTKDGDVWQSKGFWASPIIAPSTHFEHCLRGAFNIATTAVMVLRNIPRQGDVLSVSVSCDQKLVKKARYEEVPKEATQTAVVQARRGGRRGGRY
jgi:hypothetical protein